MIVGETMMYGGSSAPTGFLLCDGSAVSRTTYADLFAKIGTTFGSGDGSTTFNVPNMKGRIAIGYKSTDTNFDAMGETGGASSANLAHSHTNSHTHTYSGNVVATGSTLYVDNGSNATFQSRSDHVHSYSGTTSAPSDTGMNSQLSSTQSILNPYVTINYIIRYKINPPGGSFIFNIL